MFDTLLLRPSLHCNTPLHFTTLPPTALQYTSLHFTTLHYRKHVQARIARFYKTR